MTSPGQSLFGSSSVSTWAVIGGVFVAGLLGGAAVRSVVWAGSDGPRLEARAEEGDRPRGSEERRGRRGGSFDGTERFVAHLQKELDLTPDQAERIGVILEERERETSALLETIAQPMREALERTESEIRNVLDDEQRVKFEKVVKDGRRRYGNSTFGRRGSRPESSRRPPPDSARP